MMRSLPRSFPWVFLTSWLMAFLAGVAISQESADPRIRLSQEAWDFGTVRRGEQAGHTPVISNEGQETLYIAAVRSGCSSCSVVEGYRQRLEPGQSTDVKVTIKDEGRKGRVTQTAHIDWDDPRNPQVTFRLTANVEESQAPEILIGLNPFNSSTIITYTLTAQSTKSKVESGEGTLDFELSTLYVTLNIFNVIGQEVATLVDGVQSAGFHSVLRNATGMPAGVYFCRLEAGGFSETKPMILLKQRTGASSPVLGGAVQLAGA